MPPLREEIVEALRNAPDGTLTSPQVHYVVPGTWEVVGAELEAMEEEGLVTRGPDEKFDGPYPAYTLASGGEVPGERWTEERRKEMRGTPDDYPEELRWALPQALLMVEQAQESNYGNPQWEPVIGLLEAKLEEVSA